ncbi:hypothetical protein THRCLA_20458 [Thraustotheca clavata]|uniref:CCHC-type domain-containing protein n=1 Tax=Thraustotheca clavata TaxID=74557 RepID=A0A1W0A6Y8_9STRA|nr:hypothetical protein THRCLA_20458 [Thraustotheca clavata]
MSHPYRLDKIIKLKAGGSNYQQWAKATTDRLEKEGLDKYLNANPNNYKIDDDLAAMAYVRLSLHRHDLMYLKEAKTAYETWETLRKHYEGKSGVHLLLLYTQMSNLRWIESKGSLSDFAQAFLELKNKMEMAGDTTPESAFIIQFMALLPSRFNRAILNILHDSTKVTEFPTLAYVVDQLKAIDESQGKENKIREPVQVEFCEYCSQEGHLLEDCYRRQRDEGRGVRRQTMPHNPPLPLSPVKERNKVIRGQSMPTVSQTSSQFITYRPTKAKI